nr:MAG TPA: hypothetical protein [Caudoviricetes sp.]
MGDKNIAVLQALANIPPYTDAQWLAMQQAEYAKAKQAVADEQTRIDEYNKYNRPLLGIPSLGQADYSDLNKHKHAMYETENRVISDARQKNLEAQQANNNMFDAIVRSIVQDNAARINANRPNGSPAIGEESVRNGMFPNYKPGRSSYTESDYLQMLAEANAPKEYIDAFSSKYVPMINEADRLAQLRAQAAVAPPAANTAEQPVMQVQAPQLTAPVKDEPMHAYTRGHDNLIARNIAANALHGIDNAKTIAAIADAMREEQAAKPSKATKATKTTKEKLSATPSTPASTVLHTLIGEQSPALTIGSRGSYIPSTGFTTPNNAGGAPITISPVSFGGDNGGLQYGAMNALYADPRRAPSLGEVLAFGSILNGKKELGGLADVTATMQNADKMNAYAAQEAIVGRMQELMAAGASADEARYQAIGEQMLAAGQDRGAAAIAIPEYAKAADAQAARVLDALTTAGGDYTAHGAFGYTPLGIKSVTANQDGSYNMNIGGRPVEGIAPEYTRMSVYGAIKGDGSGSKLANAYDSKFQDTRYKTAIDSAKAETEAAKILYELNKKNTNMTPEEKLAFAEALAEARAKGTKQGKASGNGAQSGNVTGIDPSWF